MLKNGWTRDLHIAGGALIIHKDKLIVTERKCHLVCIEPETGDVIWDTKIDNVYGWLAAIDYKVIYLEQFGLIRVIDFKTGKVIKIHQMIYAFMGYVLPYKNYLITGSWRGYTDLTCINLESDSEMEWKRDTRSKDVKYYSIPMILDNDLIFSDNSSHKISRIDIATGDEFWTIDLPSHIDWLDLDYTFQIDHGHVIVYSKTGGVYKLDMDDLNWNKVIEHTCGIKTRKPKVLQNQYLFQDSENMICSYDKQTGKLNWKFYSNHFQYRIPALEINPELTLICLGMHKKLIIDKSGEIIKEFKSEKRYGSDLFNINGDIYYLTCGKLKQLKNLSTKVLSLVLPIFASLVLFKSP